MTTPSEPSLVQLWLHGGLDLSEQLQKEAPQRPAEDDDRRPAPRRDMGLFNLGVHGPDILFYYHPLTTNPVNRVGHSMHLLSGRTVFRRLLALDDGSDTGFAYLAGLLCGVLAVLMLLTAADLPPYGSDAAPTVNEVARRYVEQGTEETGAVNTVAGMILDYRAFDTLGESFVLFTAMCAVTILLNRSGKKRWLRQPDVVDYASDPIVAPMCRFLIPVILVFGIYILLNGHLSPGGGFSGGSILAAGLMLFAMVWGDSAASAVLRPRRLQTVVLCSLGFYCLAKSYSFYTGANHLHSIISPGTPGRILSAGLILPLNVAVGFVVCCTMYSFYMYFRRGEL